jgi:hypothetical protein
MTSLTADVRAPKGMEPRGSDSPLRPVRVCGTMAAAMTPDIVANAIVAALSAGAVAGTKDTAKSAIADAYQGLKSLIKKKFGHDSDTVEAIDKLEAKPDSDGKKQVLVEELKAVDSASDPELISAAQSLLGLIKALPQGEKHIQVAQGTGIAQADRGSTATVTMNTPLRKND